MAQDVQMPIALDDVVLPEGRRSLNGAEVRKLAASIEKLGLKHPITVRRKGDQYVLVAGLHRVEAFRKLGREHIPATISSMTNGDARLWEIAENVHRAELTVKERTEQIAEWLELAEKQQGRQVAAPVAGGQQPNSRGVSKAARELGVSDRDVRRALKIASISDEAKEAASEAGFDDNQAALLKIAAAPKEKQVATVHQLHADRQTPADAKKSASWRKSFDKLWSSGRPEDRAWAMHLMNKSQQRAQE